MKNKKKIIRILAGTLAATLVSLLIPVLLTYLVMEFMMPSESYATFTKHSNNILIVLSLFAALLFLYHLVSVVIASFFTNKIKVLLINAFVSSAGLGLIYLIAKWDNKYSVVTSFFSFIGFFIYLGIGAVLQYLVIKKRNPENIT